MESSRKTTRESRFAGGMTLNLKFHSQGFSFDFFFGKLNL